ncbi:choice-of-anchor D domain-containing protein [Flammeovirga yaeyamensis]|uniref:Choice-of-anchor D domain-containing protein n=1 Tax=Flammeovirga yaeyamensis TaxID=367791 RepID=A0AAX1NBE8_9BACT|nr:choice-of-anchor D domain-containing protein [Flammeovirga yaeyamensis]MBB3697206.1 hypothetical protein [Flammeovirga yaeyamensis]NMF33867.1 choice-of-anchor D domain-containing protein [Flammeovirga yaeyamensis]QWG04873.1 choice-of-anchor D domain-containing protein [Flammeovirga yaeyamensis]
MKYTIFYIILFGLVNLTANAQISISGEDEGVKILPDMAGYNNNTTNIFNPWSNDARRNTWVKTNSPLIRYPGGTVSTYWDHRKGRLFGMPEGNEIDITNDDLRPFVQRKHVINWVTTFTRGSNPMYDLKLLYDEMNGGTNVMFVLNMVTPGADYYEKLWGRSVNQSPESDDWWAMMDDRFANALAMLEQAEQNGIPVKYIEFGNEYFFGIGPSGTGSNGGAAVEPYSAGSSSDSKMRGAFPGDGVSYASAVNNWAAKLKALYPNARLAATGSDNNSDSPSRRNSWNEKVITQIDRDLVEAVSFHIYGGVHEGSVTEDAHELGLALKSLKESWEFDSLRSKMPDDMEYWFTEFDLSSNNSAQGEKTWGLGLATIFQSNNWMKNGNLGLLAFHQFADGGSNNRLTGFGRAYAMYSWASRFCTKAQKLQFDGTTDLTTGIANVQGWKFSNNPSNNDKYLIINFSGEAQDLTVVPELVGQDYQIASTWLGSFNDADVEDGQLENTVSMPAFSILIAETAPDNQSARIGVSIDNQSMDNDQKVNLGIVPLTTSTSKVIEISNNGQEDLVLDNALVTIIGDTDNEVTLQLDQLTGSISSGASESFTLDFEGKLEGAKNFSLEIVSNSVANDKFTILFQANVEELSPSYTLSLNAKDILNSTTHDFGDFTNESAAIKRSIGIKNTGNQDLIIDVNATQLSGHADFMLEKLPAKIKVGTTEYVELIYTPNAVGDISSTLNVIFENYDDDVELTFEASKTDIEYTYKVEYKYNGTVLENNATIDLGDLEYNGGEEIVSIEMKSLGNTTILVDQNQSKIEGSLYNLQALPTDIDPNKYKLIMVRFRPLSYGNYDAKLTVVTNAENNSTMVINFKAAVINKNPSFALSVENEKVEKEFDFGEYDASDNVKHFEILNDGFVDLEINEVKISGEDKDQFILNVDGLNNVLEPSQSTDFSIEFKPTQSEVSAELSISSNVGSTPKTYTINGTGGNITSIYPTTSKVDIYPTIWKSGSTLQFKLPQEELYLSVISVIGEEIISITGKLSDVQKAIQDISYSLPKGLYIFQVHSGNEHFAKRIVKQ